MSSIKTPQEIAIMAEGGELLASILQKMQKEVRVGVITKELDQFAHSLIIQCGGQPSFSLSESKGGGGFPATTCISVNEEVVHGIPSERILKDGDIVSLDIGMVYKGYHTDMAATVPVGTVLPEMLRMIRVVKKSLKRAIKKVHPGNTIGDIGNTLERYVEDQNFHIIRDLCGHSIGKTLHEDPQILNCGRRHKGPKLVEGMTFCIEPMITAGNPEIVRSKNGWTYCVKDGRPAAHCEHTVAVTANGCQILTQAKNEPEDLETE